MHCGGCRRGIAASKPTLDMRVWLCGVRGSVPAPGAEFHRVGGNTSCVAIAHDGEVPTLVLDAGTGLRRVTSLLGEAPFRGTVLLGHLHWDHTGGLPFFGAGDRPDAVVHLLMPDHGVEPLALLARVMAPPHFPIAPNELRGTWTFANVDEGRHDIEGFEVIAREIPHKGGRTFGYRITDRRGRSLAYMSDHGPDERGTGIEGLGEIHDAAVDLARDVDLLIHDAQHTADETATRRLHGHSAAGYGALLAERSGARRLMLFHHHPNRTDTAVAEIESDLAASHPRLPIDAATEGMVIDL